ncbi:uncharacterized protein LOC116416741 [Nasonia vitripennis]|uniref:Uncharacterized protein n=1 Tax=Nasonia vitripennis TaxID=7425 RepID=A0A7M7Q7C8_NASVI|nr:uncharacterized protein LOC116416741 [Nasonia vitripennis]
MQTATPGKSKFGVYLLPELVAAVLSSMSSIYRVASKKTGGCKGRIIYKQLDVGYRQNGFTDDMFGSVRPVEVITSLGPPWNFTPSYFYHQLLMYIFLSEFHSH